MGLESEVETFHLRKEAEGAGRSLPCFLAFFLSSSLLIIQIHPGYPGGSSYLCGNLMSRRPSVWAGTRSARPLPRRKPAVLGQGLGYFRVARRPRTRQEIPGADMPQQGPFKSSYPQGAAIPTGRRQSTAARQSASRETGHHARRQRCRGLALVGDVWRHAIRCTHAALESISCVRYGNDCKWEQRQRN